MFTWKHCEHNKTFSFSICMFYWTGCPRSGFYGEDCSLPCSQYCQGENCNLIDGTCSVCVDGYTGAKCNKSKKFCFLQVTTSTWETIYYIPISNGKFILTVSLWRLEFKISQVLEKKNIDSIISITSIFALIHVMFEWKCTLDFEYYWECRISQVLELKHK